MSKYVWFSGATDVTGQAIADALDIRGTKSRPRSLGEGDIVIGWGTKTDEDVTIRGATILNHPNKIRANRNKLEALKKMSANRDLADSIVAFAAAGDITRSLGNNRLTLPIVGRKNYHQGGKGFWICLTKQHVERAISDGAQYFQNYIAIKDEYRLHVAFGSVIYAVKKVENASEASWTAQRKEKILEHAQKNNRDINEGTLAYVLSRMFKEAALPDRIVRSNNRGWKFSNVRLNEVAATLRNAAIKSVEVAGLDFGAVDCAIGLDNNPYIIEINSGPGLQGTALQKYGDAFQAKIAEIEAPVERAQAAAAPQPRRNAARRRVAVGADVAEGAENQGMARVMQNVQSNDEARALIDALMNG